MRIPFAVPSVLLVVGCSAMFPRPNGSPVPDFEVLATPRPAADLPPGAEWLTGIGPAVVGEADESLANAGVRRIDATRARSTATGLDTAIRQWVTTAFDLEQEQILRVEARDLTHRYVNDVSRFQRPGKFLLETITASEFTLVLSKDSRLDASLGANRAGGEEGISLEIQRERGDRYTVEAGSDVAFAIRVVEVQAVVRKPKVSPIDASTDSRGKIQNAGFDYRVVVLDCEPREKAVRLDVSNGSIVGLGVQNVLLEGAARWSPSGDQMVKVGDGWVVDSMRVQWNVSDGRFGPAHYLHALQLSIERREIRVVPSKCGLDTVGQLRLE